MGLVAGQGRVRLARGGSLVALLVALAASAPVASAATTHPKTAPAPSASAALCSQSALTQAFLSSGDFNYYSLVPGPGATGFDGSAWTLSGSASMVTTQLADGTTGQVLDLPGGAQAVSPDVCVIGGRNPLARTMVRSLGGGGGLQVQVSYQSSDGWSQAKGAGSVHGGAASWTASNTIPLPAPPGSSSQTSTWQIVRFTFTAPGASSEFQLSNLGIAGPPPAPSTGPCSVPPLSQVFLPAGDSNYYTPAPGQTGGGFVGTGWTLTGGGKVVTTTRSDGTPGLVLDLPAGSMAVSPNICVTSLYPTARMMLRSLFGGDDLSFRVSYWDSKSWTNPHETGHVHGNTSAWTLSDSVQLQPGNTAGWQIVRLTLVPDGAHSEFQIYDLELDPYAKG